jgi:hypothetical protein
VALFLGFAKSVTLFSTFGQTSLAVCGQGMVDFGQKVPACGKNLNRKFTGPSSKEWSFSIISKISTLNDTKLLGVIIIGYAGAGMAALSAARSLALGYARASGAEKDERDDERKNRRTCRLQ